MPNLLAPLLALALLSGAAPHRPAPQQLPPSPDKEDVVRITSELVQTDVVVTDKDDRIASDLKLEDFEVYENGRRQELKFMEFVSVDTGRRTEGQLPVAGVGAEVQRDLTAQQVKRVVAFVVDDVTIPAADMARVRDLLTDFVENKMEEGDLVAFVRTVGGKGLLEQFTSDKQILRRAIALLMPRPIPPFLSTTGSEPGRITSIPTPGGSHNTSELIGAVTVDNELLPDGPTEGVNQISRAALSLTVSNFLVDSMRQIPGRKSLVLVSGGLPLSAITPSGSTIGDVTRVFRQLMDNAVRSGVAINTLDVLGLKTAGAVAKFTDTPAKSALGGGTFAGGDEDPTFGRTANMPLLGDRPLDEQLGLRGLAEATGGVSVVNSNNFREGLEKVLSRSRGYYRLAFKPSDRFDNKFRKIEIKVRRSGLKTYAADGYYAREDRTAESLTKEEQIFAAARSPLAKRDLDISTRLQYKFVPEANQAELDINVLLNAERLSFQPAADGKRRASFDVVGFVFDQLGRSRGGFSQTVNADLTPEGFERARQAGINYTASTRLPPGYYQVRLVVREAGTGNLGTASRYFEVPDLSNKRLTASSLLLYAVDPQAKGAGPVETLQASPQVSRQKDLRYAVVIYNAKLSGGRPQVRTQLFISQNGRAIFQEPEQPVEAKGGGASQLVKLGQLGLSRVAPGRYVMTLVVTDPLADRKHQRVARSAEFIVE